MASKVTEESLENICVLCYKTVDIFSVGQCEHPVCFECSTRMRVLCRQNECPICRQDMPMVVFTKEVKPFSELKEKTISSDLKYFIFFSELEIKDSYYSLLEHNCIKCKGKTFPDFASLRYHNRRVHELSYCDLCVNNLKIFTRERKCYTREQLGRHRRLGDTDDTSHKGHPLCEFCDTRFMDQDELYRHLRRTHLYCHFCDADGYDHYYKSYDFLRDHFRSEHFLCEEGECVEERFTSVFRTEIDYKAHRASVHGRALGKAGMKQARTLELEFTLAPRPRGPNRYNRQREEESELGAAGGFEEPMHHHHAELKTDCMEEFPTLGGKPGSHPPAQINPHKVTATIRSSSRGFAINDENFPALRPEATVSLQVNSERPMSSILNSKPTNLSIQVNHRPSGFTTKVSSSRCSNYHNPFKEDFPALAGKMNSPVMNYASSQWSSNKPLEPKVSVVKQKAADSTNLKRSQPKTFHMDTDFPSLSSQFSSACSLPKEPAVKSPEPSRPTSHQGAAAHSSDSDTAPVPQVKNKKKKKLKSAPSQPAEDKSKPGKKEAIKDQPGKKKGKENKDSPGPSASSSVDQIRVEKENKKEESKKSKPRQVPAMEEFPSLGKSRPAGFSDPPKVPPGFEPPKSRRPPPGLDPPQTSTFTAPPGFGESYTNGVLYSNLNQKPYISPVDFAKRNSSLIGKVVQAMGQTKLDSFKEVSVGFRSGDMSAEDYYAYCESSMGTAAFFDIFPELLALLPDVQKQQELWPLIKQKGRKELKNKLEECATCGQILKAGDLRDHLSNHVLENHFPILNGMQQPVSNAWAQK